MGAFFVLKAIVTAPDLAKQYKQQVVETEHLLKSMLEQPDGLTRRVVSKAGGDPSRLLDKTDKYIRDQPRVSGDAGQVTNLILRLGGFGIRKHVVLLQGLLFGVNRFLNYLEKQHILLLRFLEGIWKES